ncbi:pentapeptide repeat-containing protein [Nocardia amamiensis]|uniref:Pentapeptide repeat-containing protein n=1 Tax=Nocardia amamiensis TaxID=404578 RepID=A0ABS0D0W8_9NOCA|nr:pentapeptide repeat-containing protein [Nocardia amamiensis]MBF6302060.1 pentapeptide repeat-containing protein [Nocardia amamiensis]
MFRWLSAVGARARRAVGAAVGKGNRAAWGRRVSRTPLFPAVFGALVTGLGIAFVAYAFLRWITPVDSSREAAEIDVTRLALTVVAGVGGVVALVIAYRRQRDLEQSRFVERFGAAAAQLGATDVAVRIAGVYAMAGVADESDGQRRQQCIDVLCGYLRLPYTPDLGGNHQTKRVQKRPIGADDGEDENHFEYRQNDREVRATIVRVIADHLRADAEYNWSASNFDFRTAHLENADFSSSTFAGVARFGGATFTGATTFNFVTFDGNADFHSATFSGATEFRLASFSDEADFREATFTGAASFAKARFARVVSFDQCVFASTAMFDGACFTSIVRFRRATFTGVARFRAAFQGVAWFSGATFKASAAFAEATFHNAARFNEITIAGRADFTEVTFTGAAFFTDAIITGVASFRPAAFGADATFRGATFHNVADFSTATVTGDADFTETTFGGDAGFSEATFIGDTAFHGAEFGKETRFRGCRFGGAAEFHSATFGTGAVFEDVGFGSRADFTGVDFGTATVVFNNPRRWGPPPPVFDWTDDGTGKPPNVEPAVWPPAVAGGS